MSGRITNIRFSPETQAYEIGSRARVRMNAVDFIFATARSDLEQRIARVELTKVRPQLAEDMDRATFGWEYTDRRYESDDDYE